MSEEVFESSISHFEYGPIGHGVGGTDFLMCSMPANLTLPDGMKRHVSIDMTFFKNGPTWVPGRLINTVIDASQAVLNL